MLVKFLFFFAKRFNTDNDYNRSSNHKSCKKYRWVGDPFPKMKMPNKIRKAMEQMQNIKFVDDNTFEIVQAVKGHFLPFDTSIYSGEIEKGYQTGIARSRIESYYEKYRDVLDF